jgi:hypothetical protein
MIARAVPRINGSGSGRPENIRILRIRLWNKDIAPTTRFPSPNSMTVLTMWYRLYYIYTLFFNTGIQTPSGTQ